MAAAAAPLRQLAAPRASAAFIAAATPPSAESGRSDGGGGVVGGSAAAAGVGESLAGAAVTPVVELGAAVGGSSVSRFSSCVRSASCTRFAARSRLESSAFACSRESRELLCVRVAVALDAVASSFSSSRRSASCSIRRRYSPSSSGGHCCRFAGTAESSCQ